MSRLLVREPAIVPATAIATRPKRGMELAALRSLGLFPGIAGGAGNEGTHTAGDIITQTADGTDLNQLWNEFQQTVAMHNEDRQRIIDLLTFSVSQPIERVPQMGGGNLFEEASEFGEPRGVRVSPRYFAIGYDFRWYDLAMRFTWKFLADATAAQVESLNNLALGADSQLLFRKVMEAVFDSRTRTATIDDENINVYPFYNGDGTVPPAYKNKEFDATENHYMTSGGTTLTGQDVVDLVRNVTEHGYGDEPGMTVMVIGNETETDQIAGFRREQADSPHDFIPVAADFSEILAVGEQVAGAQPPPSSMRGMEVTGRYGKAVIVRENFIPSGYLLAIVSSGEDSVQNPVGIREHQNAALRGLRLIKGRDNDYPLVDSFYGRAFGTGIRHRGAGAVMEITDAPEYTAPPEYTRDW
jgi:hypothetical protein